MFSFRLQVYSNTLCLASEMYWRPTAWHCLTGPVTGLPNAKCVYCERARGPCRHVHTSTIGRQGSVTQCLQLLPSRAEYLEYSTTEILGSENYKRLSSCPSHARQTRVLRSITYYSSFARALSHKGVSPQKRAWEGADKVLSSWLSICRICPW